MINQLSRVCGVGGEAVDPREEMFDAADYFRLFFERWGRNNKPPKSRERNSSLGGPRGNCLSLFLDF